MRVLPPAYNSVHSPISLYLDFNFVYQKDSEKVRPSPKKIKWDVNKSKNFVDLMKNEINRTRLSRLNDKIFRLTTKDEIDECTESLSNILVTNAIKIFKLKKPKKLKNSPW